MALYLTCINLHRSLYGITICHIHPYDPCGQLNYLILTLQPLSLQILWYNLLILCMYKNYSPAYILHLIKLPIPSYKLYFCPQQAPIGMQFHPQSPYPIRPLNLCAAQQMDICKTALTLQGLYLNVMVYTCILVSTFVFQGLNLLFEVNICILVSTFVFQDPHPHSRVNISTLGSALAFKFYTCILRSAIRCSKHVGSVQCKSLNHNIKYL